MRHESHILHILVVHPGLSDKEVWSGNKSSELPQLEYLEKTGPYPPFRSLVLMPSVSSVVSWGRFLDHQFQCPARYGHSMKMKRVACGNPSSLYF